MQVKQEVPSLLSEVNKTRNSLITKPTNCKTCRYNKCNKITLNKIIAECGETKFIKLRQCLICKLMLCAFHAMNHREEIL